MSRTDPGLAVITGASSGLGAIFAEGLVGQGHSLLLTGRDEDRLDEVRRRCLQLAPGASVEVVASDLATSDGQDFLLAALEGRAVAVLVNNAGFATYGRFAESDPRRMEDIVGVNIVALQRITAAVLPGMIRRGTGGILNVASTIAFQPAPFHAVYGGTKAFVVSFSQALWTETRGTGVTVTAVCPGPTETGFVAALDADVSGTAVYRRLAAPGPVVDAGLEALRRGRPLVISGWRNRFLAWSTRLIPGALMNRVTGRMLAPAGPSRPTRELQPH